MIFVPRLQGLQHLLQRCNKKSQGCNYLLQRCNKKLQGCNISCKVATIVATLRVKADVGRHNIWPFLCYNIYISLYLLSWNKNSTYPNVCGSLHKSVGAFLVYFVDQLKSIFCQWIWIICPEVAHLFLFLQVCVVCPSVFSSTLSACLSLPVCYTHDMVCICLSACCPFSLLSIVSVVVQIQNKNF